MSANPPCKAALHLEKVSINELDDGGKVNISNSPRRNYWNEHRNSVCHCGNCFTIYHGEYGVLISAGVELAVAASLMKVFADTYHYDLCDSMIAYETKSALCLTTREKSELWRKHLNIQTN